MAEIGNDKIYDLINATRLEIKSDVLRVEGKVDNLEQNRIAGIEADVSRLRVKDATLATKVYVLVFIISSIMSALVSAVALRLIGSK